MESSSVTAVPTISQYPLLHCSPHPCRNATRHPPAVCLTIPSSALPRCLQGQPTNSEGRPRRPVVVEACGLL